VVPTCSMPSAWRRATISSRLSVTPPAPHYESKVGALGAQLFTEIPQVGDASGAYGPNTEEGRRSLGHPGHHLGRE
jgi:hypothetical protein